LKKRVAAIAKPARLPKGAWETTPDLRTLLERVWRNGLGANIHQADRVSDGSIFISSGAIYGENILGDLFIGYADQEDDSSERVELIAPKSKAS
jgi:hypothetical protein